MKARALQKRLNTTRAVHETDQSIHVASGMCSELLSLDKQTMQLTYALDTFNKGRDSLRDEELQHIWDTLSELCSTGEIHNYMEGEDQLENPLPVFYEDNCKIVEGVTDQYGWPNVTATGLLMYDNTFFPTREEAEANLKTSLTNLIDYLSKDVKRKEREIDELKDEMAEAQANLAALA